MRYVYVLRNLINEKVYVGQTKNLAVRKAGHFYEARKGNLRPLYASIRKHGAENFSFEVIEECDDAIINEREQFWVAHFDSVNPEKGYNLTSGGNQNFCHSEETRLKISTASKKAAKNRPPISTETKRKLSEIRRRRRGQLHSIETKRKIAEAAKNRRHSFETRQKMSISHKGSRVSDEIKQKISNGLKRAHSERPFSEETKIKMSISQKKRWALQCP